MTQSSRMAHGLSTDVTGNSMLANPSAWNSGTWATTASLYDGCSTATALLEHGFNELASVATITPTTPNTQFTDAASDVYSISEYDDDVNDMVEHGLYIRNWEILHGAHPPCSVDSDGQYFNIKYVQAGSISTSDINSPLKMRPGDAMAIELMPPKEEYLGKYYAHFRDHVTTRCKGELLVNFCKDMYKSPMFDIPDCAIIKPVSTKRRSEFSSINLGDINGVLFIPSSVTDNLVDSLFALGIRVIPSAHDTWSYGSSRIRVCDDAVICELDSSDWKGNTYTAEFMRYIRCIAVATATLTVSIVLRPFQNARGPHTSKYHLEYVVHCVK